MPTGNWLIGAILDDRNSLTDFFHRDLGSAQRELQKTASLLRVNGRTKDNGADRNISEAYKALEKAENEIQQLR